MKTLFFLLLCFLITNTCYSSLKNCRDSGLGISLLSGNHWADSVTICEAYVKSDTLIIVSDDDHLYHPFLFPPIYYHTFQPFAIRILYKINKFYLCNT